MSMTYAVSNLPYAIMSMTYAAVSKLTLCNHVNDLVLDKERKT